MLRTGRPSLDGASDFAPEGEGVVRMGGRIGGSETEADATALSSVSANEQLSML